VSALGVFLIVLSSSTHAAKPIRVPEPPTAVVFPAGGACPGFDVGLLTETRGSTKIFANGEIQSTGYERAWVTNLDSGKQIELVANGRVRITPPNGDEGLIVTTGPQIVVFFPGDVGPGDDSEARTYYFKGKTRIVVNDNFAFLDFNFSGNTIDLCAELG
jgi:hypothetical protein